MLIEAPREKKKIEKKKKAEKEKQDEREKKKMAPRPSAGCVDAITTEQHRSLRALITSPRFVANGKMI